MKTSSMTTPMLAALACGWPMARGMQVHGQRWSTIPPAFWLVGPAPSDAIYGQHLTKECGRSQWLRENDIAMSRTSSASDWLSFSIPVKKANELVDAIFSVFNPTASWKTSTLKHPVFSFVSRNARSEPMVNFTLDAVPDACQLQTTSECLQTLYGISTASATVLSNQLVVSGLIQRFQPRARPPSIDNLSLQTLDNGENPQMLSDAGFWARDLDSQYTVDVASGIPTVLLSVVSKNQNNLGDFFDMVFSTSHGFDGDRMSNNLAQPTAVCSLPSDVLFVGTTTGFGPKMAASFSSGGFFQVFVQPACQAGAINAFLNALVSTNAGRFNPNGRGFPDNFEIILQGEFGIVAGTSGSTPIPASIIALLNDQFAARCLNSLLYSMGASTFIDIISGNNLGCNTDGLPARQGWDPVTGRRTPKLVALRTPVDL
ncbi:peptidase S8/S53 domain-containing protein [Trametes punicea]|nr:peptidase S8/S53 domain-containing protein [Trametes punicea]